MQKNTAGQYFVVRAFNASGRVAGDAANITCTVSIDGASPVALTDANPTEDGSTGQYTFTLSQAETNGDSLVFNPESSTNGVEVMGAGGNVFDASYFNPAVDTVILANAAHGGTAATLRLGSSGTTPPLHITQSGEAPAVSIVSTGATIASKGISVLADQGEGVRFESAWQAGFRIEQGNGGASGAWKIGSTAINVTDGEFHVRDSDGNTFVNPSTAAAIAALNDFDPATDTVLLANGVHGGAAATLTLASVVVSTSGTSPAVSIRNTNTGLDPRTALQVSSVTGPGISVSGGDFGAGIEVAGNESAILLYTNFGTYRSNVSVQIGGGSPGDFGSALAHGILREPISSHSIIAGSVAEAIVAIDDVTSQFVFTVANQVDANALTGGGGGGSDGLPAVEDVREFVDYGSAGQFTGNLAIPIAADVRSGVGFGSEGTEYVGTLAGTGGAVPDADDVRFGVGFGDGETGTLQVPASQYVLLNIGYGASGVEFVGTMASIPGGSNGSAAPVNAWGDLRSPLYLGDNYVLAVGRDFNWLVTTWPGFVFGTAVAKFQGRRVGCTGTYEWDITGMVTDEGDDRYMLSFDLGTALTDLIAAGEYDWWLSVNDVTLHSGTVEWVAT